VSCPQIRNAAHAALVVLIVRRVARAAARSERQFHAADINPPRGFHCGGNMSDRPLILVLCTGNSARSQIAEAFLRKYKAEHFVVASAGTQPKAEVHPFAIRVMSEIGMDISDQRPKDINQFIGKRPVQHVLIVCDNANQSCPRTWAGKYSRTFMPFDDPAAVTGSEAEKLSVFRRVRDEIGQAMQSWNPELEGNR
jgi:arsenate reductase (thioredoxin)